MEKFLVPVHKSDNLEYVRIVELPDSMQLEVLKWSVANVLEPVKEKKGALTLNSFLRFLREVSENSSMPLE